MRRRRNDLRDGIGRINVVALGRDGHCGGGRTRPLAEARLLNSRVAAVGAPVLPRSCGPRAHDCVWWQAAIRSTRPHLRRGRRVPRTASRSCFAHGTRISPTATPVLVCAELAHAPDPVLARFLLTNARGEAEVCREPSWLPIWNERIHLATRLARYRSPREGATTPAWPLQAWSSST